MVEMLPIEAEGTSEEALVVDLATRVVVDEAAEVIVAVVLDLINFIFTVSPRTARNKNSFTFSNDFLVFTN